MVGGLRVLSDQATALLVEAVFGGRWTRLERLSRLRRRAWLAQLALLLGGARRVGKFARQLVRLNDSYHFRRLKTM